MTKKYKSGELVVYHDILYGKSICVVLADGVAGYGNDTRIIYVVYSFQHSATCLAYDSEIFDLTKSEVT
tara:strand:- start:96 stop:302 length:207 start_codon:yes stop_codon:yes gene_type:complete